MTSEDLLILKEGRKHISLDFLVKDMDLISSLCE